MAFNALSVSGITASTATKKAGIKTGQSLSFLNFGQALLITAGLVIVMVMAAMGVQNGTLTVGDFRNNFV